MPAPADLVTAPSLLAVRDASANWGVPGSAVATVERLTDWNGAPPLDVMAALEGRAPAADAKEGRVVVVRAGEAQVPLLARGAITLLAASAEQLLPMPLELQADAPLIERVALTDGAALLVLSPHRLLAAWLGSPRQASDASPASPR